VTLAVSAVELERRRYRQGQRRRSIVVSLVSTLVLATAVWLALVLSPGWEDVKDSFFDVGTARDALPAVLRGLWLNVRVLLVSALLVGIVGSLLAVARTLRSPVLAPVRLLAAGYTDLFRGMPLLIVLYLVGFGIPGLSLFGRVPSYVYGTLALVVTYSAYVAEVLRPQAVRKVTPALMNDFVSMQKDVGLISVLGAVDAVRAAQIQVAQTYNFTPYVVAGLLFVLLSWPTIRLTDWYSARARRREQVGALV
jgi:polar amino acid transport system permease protein